MRKRWRLTLIVGLVLTIGILHYSCQLYLVNHTQLHNVFLKLFFVPIILAAYWWGLRGGASVGLLCAGIYSIDVFRWWLPEDPNHYNRVSEIFMFAGVGILLGLLVDSDHRSKSEKKIAQQRADDEYIRAITDPLTRAFNRRHLDTTLGEFWSQAKNGGSAFSLLMIDLNQFKQINDHFGHPAGDRVLQSTVQTIFNNSRGSDLVFRCGGDEFIILLPKTSGNFAMNLANRLRSEIAKLTFTGKERESFKADFSIGVLEFNPGLSNIPEMLKKLDETLYRAKKEASRVAWAS